MNAITDDMTLTKKRDAVGRYRKAPMTDLQRAEAAAYMLGQADCDRSQTWCDAEMFAKCIKVASVSKAYLDGFQDALASRYKAQCPVETCIE